MAKNDNLTDFLTDVADAIRRKKGTTEAINPQDFSSEIDSIESGGGGIVQEDATIKDVNFYDCDGTILYSYTLDEFNQLTEMPPLPSRKGLVCQGWNMAKSEIIGRKEIGASYITDDGCTRLYIKIESDRSATVPLCFNQSVADGVNIDWGDGSAIETISNTGNVSTSHIYSNAGLYCISLSVTSGTCKLGGASSTKSVLGSSTGLYNNTLYKVEVGSNMNLTNYAFNKCYSLRSITLPQGMTALGSYAFQYCLALSHLTIPNTISKIETCFCYYDYGFTSLSLPNNITSIGASAFRECQALHTVTLPNSLRTLQISVFNNCKALSYAGVENVEEFNSSSFKGCISLTDVAFGDGIGVISDSFTNCTNTILYDFTIATKVPTLSSSSCFKGINADCKIVVPDTLYDSWIAATNWSNYASYIIKKSDYDAL